MSESSAPARRGRLGGLVILLGLMLAGCASDAELDTLKPQSDVAREIDALLDPVLIVAGVILVLICGGVLYMAVKNRVSDYDDDEFPDQIHGNNTLEIGWTIAPAVIMAAVAVGTIITHLAINETEANAIEVQVEGRSEMWEPKIVVVGQQWWWEYRYYLTEDVTPDDLADPWNLPPADIVTAGQMAIPIGEEVELIITSRDVIHSHWIPALNGKRDAVPGRFSPWIIEADDPGVYFGQCTEFCGLSHSRMRMQTVAMTASDFQQWIDDQMAPAEIPASATDYVAALRAGDSASIDDTDPVARGLELFVGRCSSCHLVDGINDLTYDGAAVVSGSAPDLTHFASRTTFAGGILDTYKEDGSLNRDDLARWIRNPDEVKDNYANDLSEGELPRGMPTLGLTERQIDDVIAFLATLGPRPSDEIIQATEVD